MNESRLILLDSSSVVVRALSETTVEVGRRHRCTLFGEVWQTWECCMCVTGQRWNVEGANRNPWTSIIRSGWRRLLFTPHLNRWWGTQTRGEARWKKWYAWITTIKPNTLDTHTQGVRECCWTYLLFHRVQGQTARLNRKKKEKKQRCHYRSFKCFYVSASPDKHFNLLLVQLFPL